MLSRLILWQLLAFINEYWLSSWKGRVNHMPKLHVQAQRALCSLVLLLYICGYSRVSGWCYCIDKARCKILNKWRELLPQFSSDVWNEIWYNWWPWGVHVQVNAVCWPRHFCGNPQSGMVGALITFSDISCLFIASVFGGLVTTKEIKPNLDHIYTSIFTKKYLWYSCTSKKKNCLLHIILHVYMYLCCVSGRN